MTDVSPAPPTFRDYLELTKPRLSLLSVLTALVVGLVSVDAWRTARALDREERRTWSMR